jgi:ornithine cyclodeaminase/alanine dehydrogenase-like protein (mu-crystallin family)
MKRAIILKEVTRVEKGKEILYLTKKDVADVSLSMAELVEVMDEAYKEKGKGLYQLPPKSALHCYLPGDFIHTMPCYLEKFNAAGVKLVAGYSENYKVGLPYINGIYVLFDVETGVPIAIMDSVWITAMRTGAMTGLSARYLANPDSETVGLIGTGVQGRTNIEALMVTMKNIKKLYCFDFFPENAEKYAEEISKQYGLEVEVVDGDEGKEKLVREADILLSAIPCTVDPSKEFIKQEWFKDGLTALPVDLGVLLLPEALNDPWARMYTDDQGQYNYFKGEGFFRSIPDTPPEIGKLFLGEVEGRKSPDEKIIAYNIGTGLADVATAVRLYEKAIANNVGTILPL